MSKEYVHNGISISDYPVQGWIIEGYPEPLTEQRCEEIVVAADRVKELAELLESADEIILSAYEYSGRYFTALAHEKIENYLLKKGKL